MISGLSNLHQSEHNWEVLERRWRDLGTWVLENCLRWKIHVNPMMHLTLISRRVQSPYLGRSADDRIELVDVQHC